MSPTAALGAVFVVGGLIVGLLGVAGMLGASWSEDAESVETTASLLAITGFVALLWGLYHLLVGL